MRLEKHLVLNKYLLGTLGFNDFNELRSLLKDVQEGFDSAGRSYFVDRLIGVRPDMEDELIKYDTNIRSYVYRLRENRKNPNFNLKYFQYLAILFTEMYLERYYYDWISLLFDLNEFLDTFNAENHTNIEPFTEEDLRKIAYWMATGSGKTLIMHMNYWQMLKYSNRWDNIILITPNEGLSRQHFYEMKLSGIPCKLYDGNIDNLSTREGEVLIIDIHKLTQEKKGEGVTVDVSYFEGNNLVFIDEGHKGQRTEEKKWKRLREEIGKSGFIFEYSATFGQVIGKNKEILNEYAKAIIFDYSYKYFYTDGYGKDFYVYNIQSIKKGRKAVYSDQQQYLLLTASMMAFLEQLVVFSKHYDELRIYNIEKPLWIFVGSKVSGKGLNSDIVKIIQFFDKVLTDEEYLKEKIQQILSGKSGLVDHEGNDIFQDKFLFLRGMDIDNIIDRIYGDIFGGKGRLTLHEIKNASGEIGMKTSTGEGYFGVINVGDVRTLKKLIKTLDIEVKDDHLSDSLFFNVDSNTSPINILIGSKKFIEGWNSWRVSNMGLINMGKSEGPQIIQLFGRGVRLKGKNFSLKREENPDYKIKILQTLFIFGLNADYVNAFLQTIEKEEVDYAEIIIPITYNRPEKWIEKLYTLKTKEDFNFLEYPVKLEFDEKIARNIKIDLRPKISIAHGIKTSAAESIIDEPVYIPDELFDIVDWDSIYLQTIQYKSESRMYNLTIDIDVIKRLIRSKIYNIFLAESHGLSIRIQQGKPTLTITSFEGIERWHEIVLMIIKTYILKYYRKMEKRYSMEHLDIEPLVPQKHSNMFPEEKRITLKIPKNLKRDIEEIVKALNQYDPTKGVIPNTWNNWEGFVVHFDNHLYTPLIVWQKGKEEIKSIPVKLNEGESKFVRDLKEFIETHNQQLRNTDIFLLRNLSKKGIGFFLSAGFYPDFIIWVKKGKDQHMILVDPKGIRNLGNFNDDKIQICTSFIKDIERKIHEERDTNIYLDAFILSVTPYNNVKDIFGDGKHSKREFEEHNILFQEDRGYIEKLFKKIGILGKKGYQLGLWA